MKPIQFAKLLSCQGKTITDVVEYRLFSNGFFASEGTRKISDLSVTLLHFTECYSVVCNVYYLQRTSPQRLCK